MAHLKRQPLPEQEGRASPHPVTAQLARVGGSVGQGCPFPLAYVLYVQMSKTPMHVFLALKQTNQALQRTTLSPPSFVVSVILWRLCLTSDKLRLKRFQIDWNQAQKIDGIVWPLKLPESELGPTHDALHIQRLDGVQHTRAHAISATVRGICEKCRG
eukprot:882613-Pelagomonas_calceolata.AAC.5